MADGYDLATVKEAAPYIASWIDFQRGLLRTPGVQVAIRVGDELILSQAFGYANEPAAEELRTDHLFRIASHSKTFTSTSIMQLVEQSKIRLDDPISRWVPEITGSEIAAVTIRELLGHQGGVIRDGVDTDFWQLIIPFPDRDELIKLCNSAGRVYEANEHFKYTNVGFSLLGMAIEAASGQSYQDYVTEHIIRPLGLTNTGPEYDPELKARYAAGHTGLLDGAEPREAIGHIDTRGMAAATGFYSTAEDLTRYGAAHYFGNEELISDAGKRLIQRLESEVVSNGREQGRYGLGMELKTIGSRDWIGHSGGYPGHITRTYIDPLGRAVVSVLTNCIGGPATPLAEGVIKLLDLAHEAPEAVRESEPAERAVSTLVSAGAVSAGASPDGGSPDGAASAGASSAAGSLAGSAPEGASSVGAASAGGSSAGTAAPDGSAPAGTGPDETAPDGAASAGTGPDRTTSQARTVPDGIDLASFTGRFASLMGVIDIALLGGRLVGLMPSLADPTAGGWNELQVVDENTLQLVPDAGFGPVGERVEVTRDASGAIDVVRYCGGSRWPLEVFKARRSAQIAAIR